MKELVMNFVFKPNWVTINKIRKKTFLKLKSFNSYIAEETKLVASELCENAVKYSNNLSEKSVIKFELKKDENKIKLSVLSNFKDNDEINNLRKTIDRINKENNPEKLYTERLVYLLENSKNGESKLGLLRIVYETKYKLGYEVSDNILIVTAERNLINMEENNYAKL